jgi:hypothetical protein
MDRRGLWVFGPACVNHKPEASAIHTHDASCSKVMLLITTENLYKSPATRICTLSSQGTSFNWTVQYVASRNSGAPRTGMMAG